MASMKTPCVVCGDTAQVSWPVPHRPHCLACVTSALTCGACSKPRRPDDQGHVTWIETSVSFVHARCA